MVQQNAGNVLVIWRGKQFNLQMDANSSVKELGHKLQELTNVKADTLRLFVPQINNKGSRMLSPFSDSHSVLSLQEASVLEGKPIKMMGASSEEIEHVSQNQMRSERILGFEEEEKRLRQRATYRPQAPLRLPQGPYIFCEFRTLHIPGVELNPPPSEALRRMHMLPCDPGIIAIMNKHRWRVGIMTEMAPEGYVGISPKCILGFNKNHGEEISLRLRTDDFKGFRKYDRIKKTLLHELAHMVYSEHDSNFFALNKQLNEEADSLDWTKSKSQTLSGHKLSDHYEEDDFLELSSRTSGQKLGGKFDPSTSARMSSVVAAYSRLIASSSDAVTKAEESDTDGSELYCNKENIGAEPDPDDSIRIDHIILPDDLITDAYRLVTESPIAYKHDEPDPDDLVDTTMSEPQLDSFRVKRSVFASSAEPDPDDSLIDRSAEHSNMLSSVSSKPHNLSINSKCTSEPDPDESGYNGLVNDEEMVDTRSGENLTHDMDDSARSVVSDAHTKLQQMAEIRPLASKFGAEDDNQELQIIQEPAAVICSLLQKAIDKLKSEASNPLEAIVVLQTLLKIIRNVIEHPTEVKFKRLRKANSQFQRTVANYKAAMEVLRLVGFREDVMSDEVGRSETVVVLKRNDPGLLWLAMSTLEMSIT